MRSWGSEIYAEATLLATLLVRGGGFAAKRRPEVADVAVEIVGAEEVVDLPEERDPQPAAELHVLAGPDVDAAEAVTAPLVARLRAVAERVVVELLRGRGAVWGRAPVDPDARQMDVEGEAVVTVHDQVVSAIRVVRSLVLREVERVGGAVAEDHGVGVGGDLGERVGHFGRALARPVGHVQESGVVVALAHPLPGR